MNIFSYLLAPQSYLSCESHSKTVVVTLHRVSQVVPSVKQHWEHKS